MPNPIKGSDLYIQDGTLDNAINNLLRLESTFEGVVDKIVQKAGSMEKALESNKRATQGNVDANEAAAKQADELARRYLRYQQSLTDTGQEIARLKLQQSQQNRELKAQARLANTAEGSYNRLSAQYTINKLRLNSLSKEEREAAEASTGLVTRTRQIYEEMKRLQAETGKTSLNVGNYAESLRDAFGSSLGIEAAALGPAAIGAAVGAAVLEAGQYVAEFSEQLRVTRGEIQTLTNATETELDAFTSSVAAISKTFNVEQQEVVVAANAASKQLKISYGEALEFIQESFVAGSNINGELLESAKEYGTFFNEAGLSAGSFFKVINDGAKQGIFNDKAIDSVKEAAIRLRELPNTTKEALTAIGLDSEEITKLIAEKGIGAAIAQVSEQLGTLKADSPEVGQGIADIFGGAGEDAGLEFLLTLKDINNETGSLVDSNNEYQVQQLKLLKINQDLADVQVEIANALGGTGATIESLKTQGTTFLLQFLVPLIQYFKDAFAITEPFREELLRLGRQIGLITDEGTLFQSFLSALGVAFKVVLIPAGLLFKSLGAGVRIISNAVGIFRDFRERVSEVSSRMEDLRGKSTALNVAVTILTAPIKLFRFALEKLTGAFGSVVGGVQSLLQWLGILDETEKQVGANMGRYNAAAARERKVQQDAAEAAAEATKKLREETAKAEAEKAAAERAEKARDAAARKRAAEAAKRAAITEGSLAALRLAVSDLKKEIDNAASEDIQGLLPKLLNAEQALQDLEDYQKAIRDRITNGTAAVAALPLTIGEVGTDELENRLQAAVSEIEITPAEIKGKPAEDIFELLGFDISDKQKEGIKSAFDFAKQQVLELFNLRTQLATQRTEEATEQVRQAEAALQAEVTAGENGVATRIEQRRRELQDAQRVQREALEQQRKAERDERRIQTLQQTGSLITGAAKIWGQLGFPFAIPAIALMFGTFAFAKIKAGQAARQRNRKGKYEVLHQGTHHEGHNEVSLGMNADGTERMAERGEGLMIVPEQRARQYSTLLPRAYEAIKRGNFVQWMAQASRGNRKGAKNAAGPLLLPSMGNPNMEGSLRQIAANTSTRTYTDGDGNTIVEQGNTVTIIRKN